MRFSKEIRYFLIVGILTVLIDYLVYSLSRKLIINNTQAKAFGFISGTACLLSGHASFTWGENSNKAFENALALEACAHMAYHSLGLNSRIEFPNYILEKHFTRKHGEKAYYGQ